MNPMDKLVKEYDTYKDDWKIQIVKPNFGNLYAIRVTKGSVPKKMQGMFTQIHEAEKAVKSYLENDYKVPNTSRNREEKVEEKIKNQKPKEHEHG